MDLAIGVPELDPPKFLKDALIEAVETGPHQYHPYNGHPPLREALAKHYAPYYSALGRDLDPDTEILPWAGGVAGLYCALMSLILEGDEIVTFEPFWSGFINIANAAGAVLKGVPMHLVKDKNSKTITWEYDWELLEEAITENTKMLLLINPQSPSGKVFNEEEIAKITEIIERKNPNCFVLSDDVYDFWKFDPEKEYLSFANYKDNFERTITVNNAGKRFWCTGWKVGWVVAPKDIMARIVHYHESAIWNFNILAQIAMSKCIAGEADKEYEGYSSYYEYVRHTFSTVNKSLTEVFQLSKLPVYPCIAEGGFSMTLEISEVESMIPEKYFKEDYTEDPKILKRTFPDHKVPLDVAFCRWMAWEVGIAFIPGSSLYTCLENARFDFVRISICKNLDIAEKVKQKLDIFEDK